ncbi:MAG: tRNA (adenosine(37)-N6)-threonylcarbamoyltransferase complex ATPase subunit type 1 TsaE [Candidatus Parcubacteria bacterium]|nr:tRNA (adenosine(37)-N6)-threonylcarbamoyltransferase complex ATPase subunit type 1 TsaE [Burkholderiales bacterium]
MAGHLKLPDEAATLSLGRALAAGARNGLVLHLRGELGAGKTTVTRGLLRALGYVGRVKSPSYTLVEPYSVLSLNLYHFDFYRFKDQAEWVNSGFREHFSTESLCIVEWPERAGDLLRPPDLEIRLFYEAEARIAEPAARSAGGQAWLNAALQLLRSS